MRKRTYLSETHRKYSEACQREVEEMSKHPLSHEELREQMRRNRKASLEASKFIFLDLDGCLNTSGNQASRRENGLPLKDAYGPFFDPSSTRNLATVLKAEPSSKIVLLSSWNYEGFGKMKGLWLRRFLPGFVIDMTGRAQGLDGSDGKALETDPHPQARAIEVRSWLRDNGVAHRPFVILDEKADYGDDLNPHVVPVDPATGLTDTAADRVISLLKSSAD